MVLLKVMSHLQNCWCRCGNFPPKLQPEVEDGRCRPTPTESGGTQGVFGHFRQARGVLACCHAGNGSGVVFVMPLRNETHQLQDREAQNSEHQMAHHFVRSAHPHGSPAMVILQSAIDPFGGAAFTVTNLFRHAMPDTA